MLTEIINDKKFRIFFVVLVAGIMMTFMGVPDCISLGKPVTDITNLWEADPSQLKNGAHVCFDVSLVYDNISSEISQSKTMGVTTSEKETSRYYLIPLLTVTEDSIYPNPFLVAKISSSYNSVMTTQINKSDQWAADHAGFEDIPFTSIHFDGRLSKMPSKMRTALEGNLDPGDRFEDYFIPYVFEPIANPSACYIMTGLGIVCLIVSVVIIVLTVKSFKEGASFAPKQKSNYEYYGPQGAETPYQSGFSTTARTANVANNAPTVKDMVGGAFATSNQLPPTTPARPFGNKTGSQASEQLLSSLKQRQMPTMPEPEPYVSPFTTPAGADASANPLYGGAPVVPAGADAAANPLYGGAVTPSTPEEYVSPLANQGANINYNPAYGQAPTENYAPTPSSVITADALSANSQLLGGTNMDPMLAQTAPIAPPVNPLESMENQSGPAGGLNPALTGQRVQPSPYTQPTPPPMQNFNAAPAQPYNPAPAQPYSPAPAQPYNPAPAQPYNPAPAQPYSPAPAQPYNPAPAQPYSPAPAQPYSPAPAQPYNPAPAPNYNNGQNV